MMDLDHEEAHVLLLNHNYKLIKQVRLSQGGITETAVDIRVIMKNALLNNATIIVLVHNHPSNNVMPSRDDDRLTTNVKKACETMRIFFSDHVIITDGNYYSYRERGRL
jgi:DNA repair protein RadC